MCGNRKPRKLLLRGLQLVCCLCAGLQFFFGRGPTGKLLRQRLQPFQLFRQHLRMELCRCARQLFAPAIAFLYILCGFFGICEPLFFCFQQFFVGIAEGQFLQALFLLADRA